MKQVLAGVVASVVLTGTAQAAVPEPAPLDEMVRNRFTTALRLDELSALKRLPVIEDKARAVRAEWVESYEGWKERQEAASNLSSEPPTTSVVVATGSIQDIICSVFGPYCSQALSVVACESGFNTAAANGQYLGLFQMGESERATYGHGADARTQAEAAFAYFVAAGSDWSPWACKP